MALTELDQQLLERCLERRPRAWEDFVDRFLGLVIHVVNYCAEAWPIWLSAQDREDLCADVMLGLIQDDFAVLRRFRRESSLATYLTVVARRIVIRQLSKCRPAAALENAVARRNEAGLDAPHALPDRSVEEREEVGHLFDQLSEKETSAVQMYYFDGRDYAVIGRSLGIPENSVGPVLSRARSKMRRAAEHHPAGWSPAPASDSALHREDSRSSRSDHSLRSPSAR